MSQISVGTTLTNAFVVSGDTTGALTIKTGATPTTAITISASQVVSFANAPAMPAQTTFNGVTYTFPAADGSANTYLKTNGAGTLTWSTVATGAQDYVLMFSYGIV
jgi:hypothetical protein